MTYAELLAALQRMTAVQLAAEVVMYSPNMAEVHDVSRVRAIEQHEVEELTVHILEGDPILEVD